MGFVKKYIKPISIILILILYFILSVSGLDKDAVNPDGINWHTRSQSFTDALIAKDYKATFQAYHPGITLMWLTGPILKTFVPSYHADFIHDNRQTFLQDDYHAKLAVVSLGTVLFAISIIILWKVRDFKYAAIFAFLFSLEPFIIGLRRLYHLDYLMAMFLFISFLSYFGYFIKKQHALYFVLGSLALVLAVLTKTAALLFLPVLFLFLLNGKVKDAILLPILFVIFLFMLMPALWGNPIRTTPTIYKSLSAGVIDIGIENKKEVGSSGETQNIIIDEGKGGGLWYFYLLEIPFVLSPICLLFLLCSFYIFKKKQASLTLYSLLTAILFIGALSYADKKGLRYGIIFIPYLLLIITTWLSSLSSKWLSVTLSIFAVSLIPQFISIYPYFYVYGNPLFGGVSARTKIFQPSSFGVGAFEASQKAEKFLLKDSVTLVSASKPFRYTLPIAKIKSWPNCEADIAIIYADDSVQADACGDKYVYKDTVTIGNLDYWKIYVSRTVL